MTSISLLQAKVNVIFFRDASVLYSGSALSPATDYSAGTDLRACLPEETPEITIAPGERYGFPTGIAIEPCMEGIAGFIYSRSGLGAVTGLTVAQGVGVIDPDYRGEITVFLLNTGTKPQTVRRGDRIAQIIFQPFVRPVFTQTEELGATLRGAGGFGHTGSK